MDVAPRASIERVDYLDTPVLESEFVRLEPLSASHGDDLAVAAQANELSSRAWYTSIPSPDTMAAEIDNRLAAQRDGTVAPWAVIDPASGHAVGMTTYMGIDSANRRLEIGSTWLAATTHGTKVNPAAKLLLLGRAFDDLRCIAVEFRTHWHNRQSRAAIEKLGAKQDGVLRNHSVLDNGTVRDTVVYSIIDGEWPTVKFALGERLRD